MTALGGIRSPSIFASRVSVVRCAKCYSWDSTAAMDSETQFDAVRERAKKTLARLRGVDDDLSTAKTLVEALRNQRDYDLMGQLAEAVSRRDPKDVKNRRLYAQYLIDTGKATAAIDLLQPLARRLPQKDPEFAEATGLLGRAHKPIFFHAVDQTAPRPHPAPPQPIP